MEPSPGGVKMIGTIRGVGDLNLGESVKTGHVEASECGVTVAHSDPFGSLRYGFDPRHSEEQVRPRMRGIGWIDLVHLPSEFMDFASAEEVSAVV